MPTCCPSSTGLWSQFSLSLLSQMRQKLAQMIYHPQQSSHLSDSAGFFHGFHCVHFVRVCTHPGSSITSPRNLSFLLENSYISLSVTPGQHRAHPHAMLLLCGTPDEHIIHLTQNTYQSLKDLYHALLEVLWCR